MTFTNIGHYVKELGLIFSPQTEAYKSVGSFIAIGSIFPVLVELADILEHPPPCCPSCWQS